VALGQLGVGGQRVEAALRAQPAIPVVAHRHVADLVAQDDVEDLAAAVVTGRHQLGLDGGRSVQSARFQRTRHQRQSRQQIGARALGHLPQAVVGIEVAVAMPERGQVVAQHLEVQRLLVSHGQPLAIERIGQAGEAPDHVQREIDRIQLDVGQRMQQRGTALQAVHRALLQPRVRYKGRPLGAAGDACRFGDGLGRARIEIQIECTCGAGLVVRVTAAQEAQRLMAGGGHTSMVCAAAGRGRIGLRQTPPRPGSRRRPAARSAPTAVPTG
jgi:hypothetical protein